jgi:hypothetical protein
VCCGNPSVVLFFSVPFYSVLFCSVLFCSVLFCSVLFCALFSRIVRVFECVSYRVILSHDLRTETYRHTDGCMDRWREGRTDQQTDRQTALKDVGLLVNGS